MSFRHPWTPALVLAPHENESELQNIRVPHGACVCGGRDRPHVIVPPAPGPLGLVFTQITEPSPRASDATGLGRAREPAFLASSELIWILLVCGGRFETHHLTTTPGHVITFSFIGGETESQESESKEEGKRDLNSGDAAETP